MANIQIILRTTEVPVTIATVDARQMEDMRPIIDYEREDMRQQDLWLADDGFLIVPAKIPSVWWDEYPDIVNMILTIPSRAWVTNEPMVDDIMELVSIAEFNTAYHESQ